MAKPALHVVAAAALLCLGAPAAHAQEFAREAAAARELQQMCRGDGGRLWGASLCGPLLVADPATRRVWASQRDGQGVLQLRGEGWAGQLPNAVPIANAALDWAGQRWTMLMAPLPEDPVERRVLLAHEAWHRVQQTIGLQAQNSDCAHLETERARYLLRLEMRALAVALRSNASARRRAAQHALAFRMARLTEFPPAAAGEASLDRNEGLAAYTGVKLGAEDPDIYAARTLDQYDAHDAYARAYAYATGPAYGLLLDQYRPEWRRELGRYAPADVLTMAVGGGSLSVRDLREAAERYGGPTMAAEERARAEEKRAQIAEMQRRYVEGPRLELPLEAMQFEFDPNQVTPVEGLGSFYRTLTLRDVWGEFRATEGAVISADFRRLTAAAPLPGGLTGPGWRLLLNPGFRVIPTINGAWSIEQAPAEPPSAP